MRPKILCWVDYYLPGYKAGGPIRTIVNMVEQLRADFDFLIVTRDRDFADSQSYSNVNVDRWNKVGGAMVFYASPATLSFFSVRRLLGETPHDVLYLNSFFSSVFTGLPLLIRRLGSSAGSPVILAPRGEFSTGALAIKVIRKSVYIALAKWAGLYRCLSWQASSEYEVVDIGRTLGAGLGRVYLAPDLLPGAWSKAKRDGSEARAERLPGPLRIIFLSRISPKKNLDYLLRICASLHVTVQIAICGPVGETSYWSECQALIRTVPAHVSVTYQGDVTHDLVFETFCMHDLFVFPTLGENFGHVIFESLSAGTSVIVSDQTPWQADEAGAVEVISLNQPDAWVAAITRWASLMEDVYAARRVVAMNYASRYLESSPAVTQNRDMFQSVLSNRSG